MKLSNFKIIRVVSDRELYASVDVTSGFWLFKKTDRRIIFKKSSHYWRFADTGEWTPEYQAEKLFFAHKAQIKLKELAVG